MYYWSTPISFSYLTTYGIALLSALGGGAFSHLWTPTSLSHVTTSQHNPWLPMLSILVLTLVKLHRLCYTRNEVLKHSLLSFINENKWSRETRGYLVREMEPGIFIYVGHEKWKRRVGKSFSILDDAPSHCSTHRSRLHPLESFHYAE